MDDIKINPEFMGLFYNELLDIENNKINKKNKDNKIKNEYNKIKINEKEIEILRGIINLLCDKNK